MAQTKVIDLLPGEVLTGEKINKLINSTTDNFTKQTAFIAAVHKYIEKFIKQTTQTIILLQTRMERLLQLLEKLKKAQGQRQLSTHFVKVSRQIAELERTIPSALTDLYNQLQVLQDHHNDLTKQRGEIFKQIDALNDKLINDKLIPALRKITPTDIKVTAPITIGKTVYKPDDPIVRKVVKKLHIAFTPKKAAKDKDTKALDSDFVRDFLAKIDKQPSLEKIEKIYTDSRKVHDAKLGKKEPHTDVRLAKQINLNNIVLSQLKCFHTIQSFCDSNTETFLASKILKPKIDPLLYSMENSAELNEKAENLAANIDASNQSAVEIHKIKEKIKPIHKQISNAMKGLKQEYELSQEAHAPQQPTSGTTPTLRPMGGFYNR